MSKDNFKPKFNHAFSVGFSVISEHENDEEVTEKELLSGLLRRIADLIDNEGEIFEACGAAFDSFECEPECKFCHKTVDPEKAHLHQNELVCDGCWDERLSITS